MKILTLNTHSLREEAYSGKLDLFVEGVLREKPDLIAMQEVNQTFCAKVLEPEMLEGQYPVPGYMKIRSDNHAAQVALRLRRAGVACSWAWIPINRSSDGYDEGVAIVSLGRKIRAVDAFPVGKISDDPNYCPRAVLGVQLEGLEDWFYTVQLSRWDDETEGFLEQWKKLNSCIACKRICGPVWLLGDFNASDRIHGESYEHIDAGGWVDTYRAARHRDSGITVPDGMRRDYIWCSRMQDVDSCEVIFNGTKEAVVSNHYGVMIMIKEQ